MSNEKKDIKNLNKEIASLKANLKDINNDKEQWFTKKEELKKEMHALIAKIKSVQKDRDPSEVNLLKKERDKHNAEVRKLIDKISELHKEKGAFLKKHGIKDSPERIKKYIEDIEVKIETEVLSVDKERRLMEQIKRMKKDYEALGDVKIITDKIDEISKQIDENKKKANEAHEKLKKVLKDKKKGYREFFSLSKQINVIKKQQEKAFETFISFKNSFIDVSRQLSAKLSLAKKEKNEVDDKIKTHKEQKVEKQNLLVEEKQKKVEEKLKKGEKLTTDDLIVMQGGKDKDDSEPIK